MPTHKLIYEGISYIPQGRQIFEDLTVLENLEIGSFIFRDKELIKENINDIFSKFPFFKERRNDYASNLSGGHQQILSIAMTLMQKPSLLLLDEPSLGLSPKMIKEIFRIIQKINQEGVSIILIEQNVKQAVEIASRTYVLEDGKIVLAGGNEILNNKRIKDIYFGYI